MKKAEKGHEKFRTFAPRSRASSPPLERIAGISEPGPRRPPESYGATRIMLVEKGD